MKTKIISVINQKGGTGKTTTSVNLAAAFGQMGLSVLAIDFDPQGNMSYSLGFEDCACSINALLVDNVAPDKAILESENFKLIPSDISLADTELALVNAENRYNLLKSVLSKKTIETFDYVIIDCPPSMSLLTINALVASDYILIPMQLEVLSLQGLKMILKTYNHITSSLNPSLKIAGILPVMYDKRRNITKEIKQHIIDTYDFALFDNCIRTDVKVIEAPSFGQSVLKYAPLSPASVDYLAFANEIHQRLNN